VLKKDSFTARSASQSFLARGWEEPKIGMRAWLMGLCWQYLVFGSRLYEKTKVSLKQKTSIGQKSANFDYYFVAIGLIAVADASAPQALNAYGDKFIC